MLPRHRTKPTAVGKGRASVSKTGKYSTKRRKLLYFSAFLIVLFHKTPLNSRGGKIPRVFSPSCGSVVILRFSGGERILLRAFRPPLLVGRERVFRALLLLRCFFCSFFSYPPRSSPNRLALAKAKPRMPRGCPSMSLSAAERGCCRAPVGRGRRCGVRSQAYPSRIPRGIRPWGEHP